MHVFLDTTYLMPICGLIIKEIPTEALKPLFDHQSTLINQISLLELWGKGKRLLRTDPDSWPRFLLGYQSILESQKILKIPLIELESLPWVDILAAAGLNDLLDCFITASAICHSDVLVTEAQDIPQIVNHLKDTEGYTFSLQVLPLKDFSHQHS